MGNLEQDLKRLRAEIDRVDDALLEQLNGRARLVQEIGHLKRKERAPVYAAGRERDLMARLIERNPGPFPNEAIPHVFREVVSATRSLEETLRVAYLGPPGTFGHLAARRQLGASAELLPAATISDVFAAVERGEAELGVVPVENTTQGVVTETLDTFSRSELAICAEILLPVSQNLMSQSGRLESVQRVASHPQALAQCRQWLDRRLPGCPRVELASTAAAAELAREDASVAAIGSAIAAETYGLRLVARAIEDRRDNTTRFVVIGKEWPPPSEHDLTSAVFTVRKDESGTLYHLLEPFARHGVNLAAIQSRPIQGKPWEYLFFLDIEGHRSQPAVAQALKEAAAVAHSCQVLGSFPRAASGDAGKEC